MDKHYSMFAEVEFQLSMLLRDNLYSIREDDVFGLQFVYDNINRSLRVHVGHGY